MYLETKCLATVFCFHWPVYEVTVPSSLLCLLVTQLLPPPPPSLSFSHPGEALQDSRSGGGALPGAPFGPLASVVAPLGSSTCLSVHRPSQTRSISKQRLSYWFCNLTVLRDIYSKDDRSVVVHDCLSVCLHLSWSGKTECACGHWVKGMGRRGSVHTV